MNNFFRVFSYKNRDGSCNLRIFRRGTRIVVYEGKVFIKSENDIINFISTLSEINQEEKEMLVQELRKIQKRITR
ncbi:MAG: hypothetical protein A2725_00365 [Candidatus Magasanikbacteria bacterium RIFCSPHIGHO2_01_FULL_33_34]|uniref:Uncharacterized protein n=1 Tax=Candidatus Magasanikbacteria bacterium RIFCSPHIGHO2_01_FULL_33_34 TaxID=1798671 RepID=A0A1F6LL80_9BACT|nr:MAG: hypothetical protein A2725_00365 [Candidatus Magasanikbacteria bacterium RIFCSPHIGHO2_01_FULL_33_34]OGH65814.1 MAG: hypothetical protein A3B83_03035 [Candidatus Magasanikbacteria bacterium RIFCSPHIGHO2_02_FULL_33_17]OGH75179.1 MAG: hypothetical protein A3A89_03630 [Candidatus Magasanikbacteria bacterium RIFCSPLOWO2_01_FULL_33_34]